MTGVPGLPAGLRAYLSVESLRPLRQRLRDQLERTGLQPHGVVVVELEEEGASRLGGLLGTTVQAGRIRVDLATLDRALRNSSAAAGLVVVLGELDGALTDRPGARRAREAVRADLSQQLDSLLAGAGLAGAAWVPVFLEGVRRSGVLTRAGEAASEAVEQAGAALGDLAPGTALAGDYPRGAAPVVEPRWELAELAGRATGDAHGLDDGRAAGALVLRAVAAAVGQPAPSSGAARRSLWETVGVTSDVVSGTVLVWALRPVGEDRWAVMMRERADQHLVTHLTLHELRTVAALRVDVGEVFACENPQVLQAAARARSPVPLMCFVGNPASVGLLLLERLVESGTTVRYHGDFDWPGVAIAERLVRRGARTWRMGAADYTEALAALPLDSRLALTGVPAATPWDAKLQDAMRRFGLAVHEESLMPALLTDLLPT